MKLSSTAKAAVKKIIEPPVFDYEQHLADAMHSISIALMDVSPEERQRSFQFEEQIHEAWGEQRQTDFVRWVHEWKSIFEI